MWHLTTKIDLDLREAGFLLVGDTLSHGCHNFWKMIFKSITKWRSYRADTEKDPLFDCYFYLGGIDLVLADGTSSYIGSTFLPNYFKTHLGMKQLWSRNHLWHPNIQSEKDRQLKVSPYHWLKALVSISVVQIDALVVRGARYTKKKVSRLTSANVKVEKCMEKYTNT